MLKLRIAKAVEKELDKLPNKHFCQLYTAIEALRVDPEPTDSKELVTNVVPKRRRKDVGEYRIIYWYDGIILYIDVIGRRNDGEIYKQAKRKSLI